MEDASEETNPLARAAMVRMGPRFTIWAVFLLVLLIVSVVGGSAYRTAEDLIPASTRQVTTLLAVWGYIALGLGISIVQAAVAQTNRSGRFNVVSQAVLGVMNWLGRW
jgi:hypothetical protein